MKDSHWLGKNDEDLERLLVGRWLFRGGLLVLMLLSAIILTLVGLRGINGWKDSLTVGGALVLGVAAGVLAFVMRLVDRRIHLELRRRKREAP
jgi:hypothetical protein